MPETVNDLELRRRDNDLVSRQGLYIQNLDLVGEGAQGERGNGYDQYD